ncbi:MAG: CpsD/CapB family tyrosine-protein kinase [Floccifex sp.]
MEFSTVDEKIKVVNIVSTIPNEGKSTVAFHLAHVCADKYKKVLLVDCDLRKGKLHQKFNISNTIGLSNILANYDESYSILHSLELKKIQTDAIHPLYFLNAGPRVPKPLELLSSNRFLKFLQVVRKEFDFVILDCPPISSCSDAVPVSNASDGTLYVISSKDADKRKVKVRIHELERNGANVIGLVLTKVEAYFENYNNYKYK